MRIIRLLLPIILVLAIGWTAGCASSSKKRDYETVAVRFLLETAPGEAGVTVRLPKSGSVITVLPKVFFTELDVTDVQVLEGELGKVMLFQFTQQAGRDLFRQTVTRQGLRVVTTFNNQPVGAVRMERPMSQGYVLTHIEVDGMDLEKLATDIEKTSAQARKDVEKKAK